MPTLTYPSLFADLFREFDHLVDRFDRVRDRQAQVPAMNVAQTDEELLVSVYLAGVDPDSLELRATEEQLTLKGKLDRQIPDGAKLLSRERSDGGFERSLDLPQAIDPDSMEAVYRQGVLAISAKLRATRESRTISIDRG